MVSFVCSPAIFMQFHNIALFYFDILFMKMTHIDTQFLVIFYDFPLVWQKEKNSNTNNIYLNSAGFN